MVYLVCGGAGLQVRDSAMFFFFLFLAHCLVLSDYLLSSLLFSFCVPVALFPVEDNGAAVVLSAVAGSSVQGTAVSETLHVPEPFSVARYPLLKDRPALCSRRH